MIGHVDADCFYVSAERVRHGKLRGVPVGVLGNHGACIIAKSYEMKAAGVGTGMPIWEAVPVCPEGVYVKRDFRWYETLSRMMLGIVKEMSPRVEFYSIDESFFVAREATPEAAERLQKAILRRVGVPASIGLAPTKTLAKLISDSSKPFGYGVVTTEHERQQLLDGLPVTEITGIAQRSAKKLAVYGITTCDQFAAADRALIRRLLTKTGEELWWELNGTPCKPVVIAKPRNQFIARGGSIGRATRDPIRVEAFVVRNAERLVEALDHYHLACEQVTLDLHFSDAPGRAQRACLHGGHSEPEVIRQAALWLLEQLWQPNVGSVRYMHVIAGRLTNRAVRQRSLLDLDKAKTESPEKLAAVAGVQQLINDRIGRFALRSGSTLPLTDIHADPANDYDICDIYGKSCF